MRIVPYLMTWDGIVAAYHKGIREIRIEKNIEACIQTVIPCKTIASVLKSCKGRAVLARS